MSGHGLCAKRLKNIDDYLKRIVDEGKVGGAAGMVNRNGNEAYQKSFGFRDRESKAQLKNDAIYRIWSMTKTITVTAAMTLYEKGLFRLHQNIADFLPAYKDMKVAEADTRGNVSIVPAKRPITFEHLFTMTSGIPYPGDTSYTGRKLIEINSKEGEAARQGKGWNLGKSIDEYAKAPLSFHPGEEWVYGLSHDVLGRLVEVISGKTLGEFFQENIFKPLGMKDTAFFVPKEKQARLVKPYRLGPDGLNEIGNAVTDFASTEPPVYESPGGGLNSTMKDMSLFAEMLLNKGKAPDKGKTKGERILSRKTVELMSSNHCDVDVLKPSFFGHMKGYGYGLGVRTMMNPAEAGLNGSIGEWAWDGMMGTYYLVDPAEKMTALFFIQLMSGINSDLQRGFAQTVYSAIDD